MRTEMFCWTGLMIIYNEGGKRCFEKICVKVWTRTKTRISVLIRNNCVTLVIVQPPTCWIWCVMPHVTLILELFLNSQLTVAIFWFIVPVEMCERKDGRCFHVFVILDSRLWRLFPPQLHQRTSPWILILRAGAQTGFSTVCVSFSPSYIKTQSLCWWAACLL